MPDLICKKCGHEKRPGPVNTAAVECIHGVSLKRHCCLCSNHTWGKPA